MIAPIRRDDSTVQTLSRSVGFRPLIFVAAGVGALIFALIVIYAIWSLKKARRLRAQELETKNVKKSSALRELILLSPKIPQADSPLPEKRQLSTPPLPSTLCSPPSTHSRDIVSWISQDLTVGSNDGYAYLSSRHRFASPSEPMSWVRFELVARPAPVAKFREQNGAIVEKEWQPPLKDGVRWGSVSYTLGRPVKGKCGAHKGGMENRPTPAALFK